MANVSFLPRAQADYLQGLEWYRERSSRAAAGFEAAMDVAIERIANAPERWPLCDDRHRTYTLKRYPYTVVYRIENQDVLVVAVAHASRREDYWHGRN